MENKDNNLQQSDTSKFKLLTAKNLFCVFSAGVLIYSVFGSTVSKWNHIQNTIAEKTGVYGFNLKQIDCVSDYVVEFSGTSNFNNTNKGTKIIYNFDPKTVVIQHHVKPIKVDSYTSVDSVFDFSKDLYHLLEELQIIVEKCPGKVQTWSYGEQQSYYQQVQNVIESTNFNNEELTLL